MENPAFRVHNTFIETADDAEEGDGPPNRTVSDQTGLQEKTVLQLRKVTGRPKPIPEQAPAAEDEDDEEEEEDDLDSMPLTRTQSLAYPALAGSAAAVAAAQAAAAAGSPDPRELAAALAALQKEGGGEAAAAMAAQVAAFQAAAASMPWGFMPYGMYPGWGMYPPYAGQTGPAAGGADGEEEDAGQGASSSWQPGAVPALGTGPPIGLLHTFHSETAGMGMVSPDYRTFTKVGYEGRLSVVTEKEVHSDGMQRYLVQFTAGEMSKADGVGFVFSPKLPCAKNIQRIVSIFVNQSGRICMRVFADIIRASAYVKALELGDWVEMAIDLEGRIATFNIWASGPSGWPELSGKPVSTAVFPYGQRLGKLDPENGEAAKSPKPGGKPIKLNVGHLACVVKNVGVTVTLAS